SFKIINFDKISPISELRACNIDGLYRFKGMVTKATKVVAYVEESSWICNRCGSSIKTEKDKKPTGCSCGNRKSFSLKSTLLRDLQEAEIEEIQDELEGRQPQKIRLRLFDELTDKKFSGIIQPGNKISVLGIAEKNEVRKKDQEETIFEYRLLAINFESLDEQFKEDSLDDEDMRQIIEISQDSPLKKLSESLAPQIYGHDEIKTALVLQMVGGVKKKKSGGYSRDKVHILLCGDPGLSKSILARNVNLRMPKSYYISGDETSKAGLVAIVDRDPLLNTWALKAGALSKANDSLLIIDEIDKFGETDRESLHTPMESGIVIINKADIHTQLKADCSILAISNPKEGLFDFSSGKTITQQINLPPPLMSRFDLIFVMTDKIDKEMDYSIARKIYSDEEKGSIPVDLFRKYIVYAKGRKPILKKEEMDTLSFFYHEIRKKSISQNHKLRGMPITPRHFEGLIRLSEASAKLRLSELVESLDIEIAKEIFYNSLVKLGMDEGTGLLDMARVGMGKSLNKKQRARMILEILMKELEEYETDYVYFHKLKEECIKKGIPLYEYDELIFELNKEGEIIKDTHGWRIPERKDL
ncbi:MAG: minichromosome maintenance protein MCM, partial [Nanoarchaeota archaeon]|nr:minichromosome maintenance protein MCM [Nanoarchaeota archaeon]